MRAARANRQEQTEAEAMLWELLRNRNFENIKFRRQHPIKDYIVDFFSYELQLIIELDGGYHQNPEQKEKDELRDSHLAALGYKVLRYKNEIIENGNEQLIYDSILDRKNKLTQTPPLSAGEGLGVRVLSTKKLLLNQQELLLNAGVSFVQYNAISINSIPFEIPEVVKSCIITSQNGAKAYLKAFCQSKPVKNSSANDPKAFRHHDSSGDLGKKAQFFVVGKKTARLLSKNGQKVVEIAQNGAELAHLIAKNHKNEHFYYFCGKQRRDELPTVLSEYNVSYNEIITYETKGNPQSFEQEFDGVLFFSPLGVESFFSGLKSNNQPPPLEKRAGVRYFCIGETTAKTARKYFDQVIVSNATTIESTIAKAVNYLKENIN